MKLPLSFGGPGTARILRRARKRPGSFSHGQGRLCRRTGSLPNRATGGAQGLIRRAPPPRIGKRVSLPEASGRGLGAAHFSPVPASGAPRGAARGSVRAVRSVPVRAGMAASEGRRPCPAAKGYGGAVRGGGGLRLRPCRGRIWRAGACAGGAGILKPRRRPWPRRYRQPGNSPDRRAAALAGRGCGGIRRALPRNRARGPRGTGCRALPRRPLPSSGGLRWTCS
jgi:hypothetical protein